MELERKIAKIRESEYPPSDLTARNLTLKQLLETVHEVCQHAREAEILLAELEATRVVIGRIVKRICSWERDRPKQESAVLSSIADVANAVQNQFWTELVLKMQEVSEEMVLVDLGANDGEKIPY